MTAVSKLKLAGKYDHAFKGGCGLSDSAVCFLEAVTGTPSVTQTTDKNGKDRIYVSYPVKVYGAGSRSWIANKKQCVGMVSASRSASRIQIEAMFVMALSGNKPALRWSEQYLEAQKAKEAQS